MVSSGIWDLFVWRLVDLNTVMLNWDEVNVVGGRTNHHLIIFYIRTYRCTTAPGSQNWFSRTDKKTKKKHTHSIYTMVFPLSMGPLSPA